MEFLWEYGHQSSDAKKPIPFYGIGSVTFFGRYDRSDGKARTDLATLFACFSVTLAVLEPGEEKTLEQELTDDSLALIASFSGRLYGMRPHKQKELLTCAQAVITSP